MDSHAPLFGDAPIGCEPTAGSSFTGNPSALQAASSAFQLELGSKAPPLTPSGATGAFQTFYALYSRSTQVLATQGPVQGTLTSGVQIQV